MNIGIDLDNTLICYDSAFTNAARERSLVSTHFSGTKQQLRDHIRTLPNGETEWQKLQGYVYGQGIKGAGLFPGVKEFLNATETHELFIISHKTEFGHYDDSKTNLREAALQFLEAQGVFTVIKPEHVSFHATRKEKVKYIASLGLEWFIDDLVEVYEEPDFPKHVQKILFHSLSHNIPDGDWHVCRNWQDITQKILL